MSISDEPRPVEGIIERLRDTSESVGGWPIMEQAANEIERLNAELKKRDKCAFIGPMRDCPTHGESAEIKRLREQLTPNAELDAEV